MLLVIWRHCVNDSIDQLPYLTLMIKSFFLPLFFVLSGYLYKLKPTKDFLYSKAKSLLLPLIIVYIFNFYTSIICGGIGIDHSYIKFGGYWFVEALLYISILYHFTNVFLMNVKSIKNEYVDYIMFFGAMIISGVALLYCYLYGGTPSINSSAVALGFFSFGHIYRKIELKLNCNINRVTYCLIGIILLVITLFASQKLTDYSMAYNSCSNPCMFIICSILGTLGTIYISRAINHSKFLCFIGNNTLVMLLTQMGVINLIRKLMEYLDNSGFNINEIMKVVIAFMFTVLIECIIAWFFNKIFPIFTGKPRYEQK